MDNKYNFERVEGGYIAVPKGRFVTKEEFADLPRNGTINPHRIRFSQDDIAPNFRNAVGSVLDLTKKLTQNIVDPGSIKPIRIVQKDGMIFSLDNRRLHAFQLAGIEIPYIKIDQIPKTELDKFTTDLNGYKIYTRKEK